MKDTIRPAVKIDGEERVIRDPAVRAHRWRLNVPASITGRRKERRFFKSEADSKEYAKSLLAALDHAGHNFIERLKERGMSVTEALEYALRHSPTKGSISLLKACNAFVASRKADNRKERYLANLESQMRTIPCRSGRARDPKATTYLADTKRPVERDLARDGAVAGRESGGRG